MKEEKDLFIWIGEMQRLNLVQVPWKFIQGSSLTSRGVNVTKHHRQHPYNCSVNILDDFFPQHHRQIKLTTTAQGMEIILHEGAKKQESTNIN